MFKVQQNLSRKVGLFDPTLSVWISGSCVSKFTCKSLAWWKELLEKSGNPWPNKNKEAYLCWKHGVECNLWPPLYTLRVTKGEKDHHIWWKLAFNFSSKFCRDMRVIIEPMHAWMNARLNHKIVICSRCILCMFLNHRECRQKAFEPSFFFSQGSCKIQFNIQIRLGDIGL